MKTRWLTAWQEIESAIDSDYLNALAAGEFAEARVLSARLKKVMARVAIARARKQARLARYNVRDFAGFPKAA